MLISFPKVELTLQQALHQSVFMPCTSPSPSSSPFCWDQHSKLLPTVAGVTSSKVASWTVEEVMDDLHCRYNVACCAMTVLFIWITILSMMSNVLQVIEFIQGLPGCREHVHTFRDEVQFQYRTCS